jgi:predicted permease
METVLQDLRYGFRMLWKNPGFTALTVITLALGIGANTAIFSVVYGILFRPLPYPHPERIVQISRTYRGEPETTSFTYPAFEFWKNHAQPFEYVGASTGEGFNLAGTSQAEHVRGLHVSADYFHVLGISPSLGRGFLPQEDAVRGPNVAVLSCGLWRKEFGADSQVIGKKVLLDGSPYVVIGVMPERFRDVDHTDVWTTLAPVARTIGSGQNLQVVARLKPDATPEQTQSYLDTVTPQYSAGFTQYMPNVPELGISALPYKKLIGAGVRAPLLILFGAIGLVLLIACANVAGLFMVRSAGRSREIAIRSALGARRGRLFRQLLTESLLFALVGGALGLLLAYWGLHSLLYFVPADLPRIEDIHLDGWALAFTGVAAVLTGLLFGLAPALRAPSKLALNEALKEGTGRTSAGVHAGRLRGALTVGEIALSFALLVGAALLIDTFVHLVLTDPGFDPHHALALETWTTGERYQSTAALVNLDRSLTQAIDAVPGVQSSAIVVAGLPLEQGGNMPIRLTGQDSFYSVDFRVTTPSYFRTLDIPLLSGRFFGENDFEASGQVAIVNQAFARKFLAGGPLAQHFVLEDRAWEIVGVVGDTRSHLGEPVPPTVFVPLSQAPTGVVQLFQGWFPAHIVVRTAADPRALTETVKRAVRSVDPQLPIGQVRPMDEVLSTSVAFQRFLMSLMSLFSALALVLATVGIYGLMAYSVAQRTHEFGIRIALGARPKDILTMVIGQGMVLTVAGLAMGLVGVLNLTHFLASQLYGVKPSNPVVFLAVAVILAVVATLACLIPARRAARIDPAIALRYE